MDFTKKKALARAYRNLFNSPDGELVLEHLMQVNFISSSTMSDTDRDTSFNEGRRAVVLDILNLVNTPRELMNRQIDQLKKQISEVNYDV